MCARTHPKHAIAGKIDHPAINIRKFKSLDMQMDCEFVFKGKIRLHLSNRE
jgi:hypothetical protein